jgi:hypothetical protein
MLNDKRACDENITGDSNGTFRGLVAEEVNTVDAAIRLSVDKMLCTLQRSYQGQRMRSIVPVLESLSYKKHP